jgi:hypothetical protein
MINSKNRGFLQAVFDVVHRDGIFWFYGDTLWPYQLTADDVYQFCEITSLRWGCGLERWQNLYFILL